MGFFKELGIFYKDEKEPMQACIHVRTHEHNIQHLSYAAMQMLYVKFGIRFDMRALHKRSKKQVKFI